MKKVLSILAVALAVSGSAFAATTQNVTVSASVDSVLDLSIATYKLDSNGIPTGGNLGTSMSFGQLVRDTVNNVMHGSDAYTVYLSTNTSSRPYTIKASMSALTNGTTTLPHAMVCSVLETTSIAGDVVDTGDQDAVMTNKTIYTSNTAGASATIQAVYGISGANVFTGWQPILLDQAAGSYGSTITYTIALS